MSDAFDDAVRRALPCHVPDGEQIVCLVAVLSSGKQVPVLLAPPEVSPPPPAEADDGPRGEDGASEGPPALRLSDEIPPPGLNTPQTRLWKACSPAEPRSRAAIAREAGFKLPVDSYVHSHFKALVDAGHVVRTKDGLYYRTRAAAASGSFPS